MTGKTQRIQRITRLILIILLVGLFLYIFSPFFIPILLAGFMALGSERAIRKLHGKFKSRKLFVSMLFASTFILLIAPLALFILKIANGLKALSTESMAESQFFQSVFTLWEKAQTEATSLTERFGIELNVIPQKEELFSKVSPVIINKATLFLGSLPDLGLSLFVFFCMLVIFILHASEIKKGLVRLNLLPLNELNDVIQTLQKNCYMILISTFLIGALQALLVAVGSLIFGYQEFFLIFVITFFLSFIPVIGAAPVAIMLALISFMMGQVGQGIGLLVVGVIAGSVDNVLKPYVFSSAEDNLHPLISLLGIIGSIMVFGLPGLLFGPLLLQTTVKLAPKLLRYHWGPT